MEKLKELGMLTFEKTEKEMLIGRREREKLLAFVENRRWSHDREMLNLRVTCSDFRNVEVALKKQQESHTAGSIAVYQVTCIKDGSS